MKSQARNGSRAEAQSWQLGGPEATALVELARNLGQEQTGVDELSEARFLTAFRREVAQRGARSRLKRVAGYGGALASAAALILLVVKLGLLTRSVAPLSYRISDGQLRGPSLLEASREPVDVKFSDGTRVQLEPGAHAEVLETTPQGARFRLGSGHVSFDVVPHTQRGNWSIDAGPFQVRVTGTAFSVEWDASQRLLEVGVSRGHVIVDGAGVHKELGAGDLFHWQDEPREASSAANPADTTTLESTDDTVAEHSPSLLSNGSGHASPASVTWAQLVAAGQFASVVDAAEQRGVASCLASCRLDDLNALADAARFNGESALAERALLAQRSRFAGSSEAKAAAFLLGRLAEAGRSTTALEWYDTYLSESPAGRFASDALGRSMVLSAGKRPAKAALLAAQYLERFPSGPYASHARSILEAGDTPR